MNIHTLSAVVIGIVLGAGGMYAYTAEPQSADMHHAMNSMTSGLEGKTGDAFDQAFLSEMIVHHEGAVVMAEAALKRAAHQEIKDLAEAIIAAQTREIEQMRQWQAQWYLGVQ